MSSLAECEIAREAIADHHLAVQALWEPPLQSALLQLDRAMVQLSGAEH